jgi:hypothetical protein
MVVLVVLIGYDGIAQDFKFTKQTYRFVGGMFDSVTDAM